MLDKENCSTDPFVGTFVKESTPGSYKSQSWKTPFRSKHLLCQIKWYNNVFEKIIMEKQNKIKTIEAVKIRTRLSHLFMKNELLAFSLENLFRHLLAMLGASAMIGYVKLTPFRGS